MVFSKITATELKRAGFDASSSYARLLQLAAEYLLHVQEALTMESETTHEKWKYVKSTL